MEAMSIREILEAVDGALLGGDDDLELSIDRVETDSRTIHPGSLFVPIIGEQFDGHAYINAALEGGAAACFTARERENYLPGKVYIKVKDTRRALRLLGRHYRQKFSIPVVAVAGSVGKTTTKDMIAAVLGERYKVLKTEGNLNTDIGVCATLFRLDRSYEAAVLEMGINHPGEMGPISAIAQPDVVCITNIGDSHIEAFGCRENTMKAKLEIFDHAVPGCTAILNGDDALLRSAEEDIERRWTGSVIYVGRGEGLDYRAGELESDWRSRVSCDVTTPRGTCRMDIPALGEHMIYPTLMAAAVGERFGMTLEEITAGVRNFAPTKMRMNILPRQENITILNDAYNANPQSMRAAVEVLANSGADYKLAVLGDMFELGPLAPALHASIGEHLGKAGIDCLVAVGELAKNIADAASAGLVPEVYHCADKEEAKPLLAKLLRPNTTVLVKASRGMAFEELVDYLKDLTKEA